MPATNAGLVTSSSLESAEYDPIEHLNTIFSHSSSLNSIPAVSQTLQVYENELDDEIYEATEAQKSASTDSVQRIQAAKADLADMFVKIERVRERAIQTEETIAEMTADIKRLDGTKRNLTVSMTALKRLQMLTTAYEQLRALIKTRQYRECAQLLQAVIQLMAHFKSYRSIDQIATLSRNISELERELLEQICEDFEVIFAKGEVAQQRGVLTEACLVIDAFGDNAKSRIITWYSNTQLREYRQVFRGNEEAGSLDNVARRYSWFKRMLKTYDQEHASIFPFHWRVGEMLANAFCESTREDFKGILSKSARKVDGQTLDVNLLLSCLQETMEFEQGLERKFSDESRTSIDTASSKDDHPLVFGRSISEAFEPYLGLWVESQDKQLAKMIPAYRQQPTRPPDEEFSPQSVIPSSVDIFQFYRTTLAQCAKMSTGNQLVDLSKTFARYLDDYAEQVLLNYIREKSNGQQASLEDTILVLNTADYCHVTSGQLEEKIRNRVDEEHKSSIDLQSQSDAFMGIASSAIRVLVHKIEQACEHPWREMRNTPWNKLDAVGDQSTYVAELLTHIKEKTSEILHLITKQQYARALCDNLVELLASSYLVNMIQCRPISEIGAEQMLLDLYVLKKGFEELATLNAEPDTPPPTSFLKRVNQSVSKLDPLLKTLQVRASPPEGLVQAYLIHIGDKSDTNFKKILDLKGVRKPDQAHLVEIFQLHRASHENLVQNSPLLTPLNLQGVHAGPSTGVGGQPSPASLQGRFESSTLGSAIISAARDGVDRLGAPNAGGPGITGSGSSLPSGSLSPSLGAQQIFGNITQTDGHSSVSTPSSSTANLNENLRNIGKFFRRDMSGFGGRFGSTGGAVGPSRQDEVPK